jgi:serine phosphatase RsbU (regulator of sigma subunit)
MAAQNDSLRTLNGQLGRAYETIERDLQAAAAMQLRLLPKKFEIHHKVRLDWLMIPTSFLAGDMLNYFMADDRHLVFYLLDVAGRADFSFCRRQAGHNRKRRFSRRSVARYRV